MTTNVNKRLIRGLRPSTGFQPKPNQGVYNFISHLPNIIQWTLNAKIVKMLDEKINLSWNKFGETVEKAFKDLGSSGDFSDVTLAGADGQCVKAHRVVLSSCSPILKAILLNLSHAHPLLYMRGMDMDIIPTCLWSLI